MKCAWITVLALVLAACRHDSVATQPSPQLAYPTFEPATSSRMFPLLAGDPAKVDLAAVLRSLDKATAVTGASREARAFTEQLFPPDPKLRQGPSAELLPKVPPAEKMLYAIAPIVLMKLEPLWNTPSWSAEQVELARQGAAILTRIPGAPAPAFVPGDDVGNRAGLEQLVRWYHGAVAQPEVLAATIFSLDNGPFVGLPHAAKAVLPASQSLRLDDHRELRLARIENAAEPWLMQCVRDGKPTWTRIVSGLPDGEVKEVAFVTPPIRLGASGWHVPFRVFWTYGGDEQAHLYLDPEGELRFYFLSW